jgi:hypothetical protein
LMNLTNVMYLADEGHRERRRLSKDNRPSLEDNITR